MTAPRIAFVVICISAFAPLAHSQITLIQSAVTIEAHDNPQDAADVGAFMQAAQKLRAFWLPIRVEASGGGDDVTYLVGYQSSIFDVPTMVGFPTAARPPVTFNSGQCFGGLGDYLVHEESTYADARSFYNGISAFASFVHPHTYGPLATPRGTYIVVYPNPQIACF